jgi:DnaK suppressor protein
MSNNEMVQLRDKLLSGRREILERIRDMDMAVRTLSEPEIEIEEGVQKKVISEFYGHLNAEGRSRIGLIDLALGKMVAGEYGICESCGDDIPEKRLHAVPWARLCIGCARDHERKKETLPEPALVIPAAKIPDEYARLPKKELVKLIHDRIGPHLDLDAQSIEISVHNGVIHLEGSVQSEDDREAILQVLTEEMKIEAVLDLMQVDEASEVVDVSDYSRDSSEEPIADYMM